MVSIFETKKGRYKVIPEIRFQNETYCYLVISLDEGNVLRVLKKYNADNSTKRDLQKFIVKSEAEALQRIKSNGSRPDFVAMTDYDMEQRILVTELVRGIDLHKLIHGFDTIGISGGDVSSQTAYVAEAVSRSLAWAHTNLGITHGDLKPGNIVISNGVICPEGDFDFGGIVEDHGLITLLDFANASINGSSDYIDILRSSGRTAGTIDYMSPEAIRGGAGHSRRDIWALGIVMHEMLGMHPIREGESDAEKMVKICNLKSPPRLMVDGLGLDNLIYSMTEIDPKSRPKMSEVNRELREYCRKW